MRIPTLFVLLLFIYPVVVSATQWNQAKHERKRLAAELERQVRERLRHKLDQNRPSEAKRLAEEEKRIEREKKRHEAELLRQRREAGLPDPTPEPAPERTPDPGGHLFRFDVLRLDMGPDVPQLVLVLKCVRQLPCVFCREDTPAVCITRQLSVNLDNRAAGTVPAQPDAPFVEPAP